MCNNALRNKPSVLLELPRIRLLMTTHSFLFCLFLFSTIELAPIWDVNQFSH